MSEDASVSDNKPNMISLELSIRGNRHISTCISSSQFNIIKFYKSNRKAMNRNWSNQNQFCSFIDYSMKHAQYKMYYVSFSLSSEHNQEVLVLCARLFFGLFDAERPGKQFSVMFGWSHRFLGNTSTFWG